MNVLYDARMHRMNHSVDVIHWGGATSVQGLSGRRTQSTTAANFPPAQVPSEGQACPIVCPVICICVCTSTLFFCAAGGGLLYDGLRRR